MVSRGDERQTFDDPLPQSLRGFQVVVLHAQIKVLRRLDVRMAGELLRGMDRQPLTRPVRDAGSTQVMQAVRFINICPAENRLALPQPVPVIDYRAMALKAFARESECPPVIAEQQRGANWSLQRIAEQSGFGAKRHFRRVFQVHTGNDTGSVSLHL